MPKKLAKKDGKGKKNKKEKPAKKAGKGKDAAKKDKTKDKKATAAAEQDGGDESANNQEMDAGEEMAEEEQTDLAQDEQLEYYAMDGEQDDSMRRKNSRG
ncbi:hypothetical protein niasHT_028705 [Heterodera trifolii]|uniref:Uncharacterized protein n=1 Tax=Heterodera trifolii TaxID=157864 RepID=A0ABD2JEF4_9BILA